MCHATIIYPSIEIGDSSIAAFIVDKLLTGRSDRRDCAHLRQIIMSLITVHSKCVATSSNSSTLYSTAVRTLALPRDMNDQYSLVEGRLINSDRDHNSLKQNDEVVRPLAEKSLLKHKNSIAPSCEGEHSDLMITIRERIDSLK